tara:strand:- start:120 stop:413 length:294 start_codon:yes stop_codon:yes gene_type:complete
MLFSRIFDFLNILSMPIEITAAGMEAETVIPANNPKYAFAPAKTMDSMIPKIMDLKVISWISFFILILILLYVYYSIGKINGKMIYKSFVIFMNKKY